MTELSIVNQGKNKVIVWLLIILALLLGGFLALTAPWLAGLLIAGVTIALVVFSRPAWLVFGMVFFIPFQAELSLGDITLSPQTLSALGFILVFLFFLLHNAGGLSRLLRVRYLSLWLVYLILSTIAIALGPLVRNPIQGVWAVFRIIWSAPLVYLAVSYFLRSYPSIFAGIKWLSLGSTVGAIFGILQTATQGRYFSGLSTNFRYLGLLQPLPVEVRAGFSDLLSSRLFLGGRIFRAHGSLFDHNGFGVLLSTTILLTWGVFRNSTGHRKLFWLVCMILQSIAIILTFSRSAWAGLFAAIAMIIIWNLRYILRRRNVLIGMGFSLIALLLIFAIAAATIESFRSHVLTLTNPTQVPEFNWRIQVWNYGIQQLANHPLFGMGTSMIDNEVAQIPNSGPLTSFSTHNLLMDVAYQRGLPVLILFSIWWLLVVRNQWKLMQPAIAENLKTLAIALLGSSVAFFVSGVGSASMMTENLATLFWFVAACSIGLRNTLADNPGGHSGEVTP